MSDSTHLGLPTNVHVALHASDGNRTDAVVFALWLLPLRSPLALSQRTKKRG